MRPLFAIAPLALVLLLVGPTPNEAKRTMSEFVARHLVPRTGDPIIPDAHADESHGVHKAAFTAVHLAAEARSQR